MLGPMVYGAAFCAVSNKERLARAAYADSKTLTEEKREGLFAQLKADAAMGWMVDAISAATLSAKMLRKERYNLNAISYDSAYALIQARGRGCEPRRAACDRRVRARRLRWTRA